MTPDAAKARQQLTELVDAERAVEASSVAPMPWWFGPGFGFVGPAIVWWATSELPDAALTYAPWQLFALKAGAIVFGAIAVLAVVLQFRIDRRMRVRARPPARGGRTTCWMFGFMFSMMFGTVIATNLVLVREVDEPLLLGGSMYLWFALLPAFFYSRHTEAMANPAVSA